MMSKIRIKAKYVGADTRGILVGGIPFRNTDMPKISLVDEETYSKLKAGERSGWFKIVEDNYDKFLISRHRVNELVKKPEIEQATEEVIAELVKKPEIEQATEEVITEVVKNPEIEQIEEEKKEVKPTKKKAAKKADVE